MSTHDATLGATLRSWRDRLSPAAAGLSVGRTRRASGLRREELAELAGISVDYVVRLEQGRFTTPSAQVVSSLARALQLSHEERDHLYRLAKLLPPADGQISDHIPPALTRLLNRFDDAAVAVFAADWHLVWWNRGWAALLGDPSATAPSRRNFARDSFPAAGERPGLVHWPVTSLIGESLEVAIVSDLRRATGRFAEDRRLADVIRTLSATNERFAQLWAAAGVAAHREHHKIVHHPIVGEITVDCDVMSYGESELKIVILTAAPDSEDGSKLQVALLNGIPAQSGR